jgi:hypothetical protein
MKKFIPLLSLFVLCFGTAQTLAQKKTNPKEVVIVELAVGERESAQKIEVSINRGTGIKKEKPIKPAWSKDGEGSLPPQYSYDLGAYFADKNSSKVYFKAIVERCSETVRKDFVVDRNQEIELQLDCGIKIKAYYGLESNEKRILFKLPKRKN